MKLLWKILILTTCFFISFNLEAQESNDTKSIHLDESGELEVKDITLKANNLVSPYTFNKLVFQDLNFLILGDNSPSQGLSSTLNKTGSEFSVSGLVTSFGQNFITAEGTFAATDGVYFIDDDGGSKSAKISLNFYRSFWGSRKYNLVKDDKDVQRALIFSELEKQEFIRSLFYDYEMTKYLMSKTNVPFNTAAAEKTNTDFSISIEKLDYTISSDLNPEKQIATFIATKKLTGTKEKYNAFIIEDKSDDTAVEIKINDINPVAGTTQVKDPTKTFSEFSGNVTTLKNLDATKGKNDQAYKLSGTIQSENNNTADMDKQLIIDPIKLARLYESTLTKMDSVTFSLSKKELKNAEQHWNSKQLWYWGANLSYERERLTTYQFMDGVSFGDLFNDQDGNLYNVGAQLAWYWQSSAKKTSSKNIFRRITNLFYTRLKGSLGQGSNLSSFNEFTYITTPTVVDTQGDDAIITQNSKKAFGSTSIYIDNGFKSAISAEVYWFPINGYGLFGELGYTNLNFDDDISGDTERYNLRAGILFNLKAKDKTKNLLTLQIFADRSDLDLSPNGEDANLRFGVKVGLPINIRSGL